MDKEVLMKSVCVCATLCDLSVFSESVWQCDESCVYFGDVCDAELTECCQAHVAVIYIIMLA